MQCSHPAIQIVGWLLVALGVKLVIEKYTAYVSFVSPRVGTTHTLISLRLQLN